MKKEDFKKLDAKAIREDITKLKKELFDLRLNLVGGEVKDYSQFKKLRTNIARRLTFLGGKEKDKKVD